MSEKTLKGSHWIKCDLHVHTPASFFHQYGDTQSTETWDKFVKDLETLPSEFRVIGINDYLTLDGYKKILEYRAKGRLQNLACILPVIEFRINKFAGEGKLARINYHVIFSDELPPELIQSQFLNALSAKYTLENGQQEPDWSAGLSDDSLADLGKKLKKLSPDNAGLQSQSDWQVGFNNFNVDYENLREILSRTAFQGRVITAIGKGEWDDYRWDSGGAADKRTIINEANIVFLACENVIAHSNAREKLKKDNVNARLLDCSDAHYYSSTTQKDRIGNCFTWVKAEPTFNGLKQILFEPEERISISETNPDQKAPYQVIDSVRFIDGGEYFTSNPIHLSSGLNAIIGGKSTGKSLLAGLIVKTSDPNEFTRRKARDKANELAWIKEKQPSVDFHVRWKDGGITTLSSSEEKRKISYFPQHYLNSQINDAGAGNKELNKIIRNILMQTPTYSEAFEKYENALRVLDESIAADSVLFETKLRDLRAAQHSLGEKGKSVDIQKNIDKLNEELGALKNQYDLSESELATHKILTSQIKELEQKKLVHTTDAENLKEITKEKILMALKLESLLGGSFVELSAPTQREFEKSLISITAGYADTIFSAAAKLEKKQIEEADTISKEISNKQTEDMPISEKIKNSAPLREKSGLIATETAKLEEVKRIEAKVKLLQSEIDETSVRLKGYFGEKILLTETVKKAISEKPFADGDDQLGIEIQHKTKAEHIQSILKERISYRSNPEVKAYVNSDLDDNATEGYAARVDILVEHAKTGALEMKGDHKISATLQEILTNAVYLNYDLKLSDDSFSIMSPGKRALALLRVLIELDQSQHPIVLDQPEDDLDNRSVYEGLAKYLKKKKTARQIIVVTHNPNVVVGADSEQVIVANQSGQETNQDNRKYRFEYTYGGLEDSFELEGNSYVLEKQGIREHVCEILDGGEIAFERREQLYSGLKRVIKGEEKIADKLAA